METVIGIIFILGYAAISLEHPLQINKTASSVLLGVICLYCGFLDYSSLLGRVLGAILGDVQHCNAGGTNTSERQHAEHHERPALPQRQGCRLCRRHHRRNHGHSNQIHGPRRSRVDPRKLTHRQHQCLHQPPTVSVAGGRSALNRKSGPRDDPLTTPGGPLAIVLDPPTPAPGSRRPAPPARPGTCG